MSQDIAKETISTQTELPEVINQGDFHGVSESKIITEHRCTMEATMRLEHKTAHLDLPTLTKRPKTPTGQDTIDAKQETDPIIPQTIPQTANTFITQENSENTNKSNESIKTSLYDLLSRGEKNKTEVQPELEPKLNRMQIDIPIKLLQEEQKEFSLVPGSPPEICFAPKIEAGSSVQATIEKIEQTAPISEPPSAPFAPQHYAHTTIATKSIKVEFPKPELKIPAEKSLRSPSPKCSAEGAAMTRLWGKPLNAPNLVKEVNYALLEPGSPPEICYAPKPTERRQSLVETMERTLEQNLLQGPSKVLPHSVPTLTPPSASPANTQKPKPPPPTMPTHLSTARFDLNESDYESDRYKYSGSESDDTYLRPKFTTAEIPQQIIQKSSGYAADTEDPNTNQYLPYSTTAMSSSYCEIKTGSNKLPFEKQEPAPIYYTNNNGHEKLIENAYKNDKQVEKCCLYLYASVDNNLLHALIFINLINL